MCTSHISEPNRVSPHIRNRPELDPRDVIAWMGSHPSRNERARASQCRTAHGHPRRPRDIGKHNICTAHHRPRGSTLLRACVTCTHMRYSGILSMSVLNFITYSNPICVVCLERVDGVFFRVFLLILVRTEYVQVFYGRTEMCWAGPGYLFGEPFAMALLNYMCTCTHYKLQSNEMAVRNCHTRYIARYSFK